MTIKQTPTQISLPRDCWQEVWELIVLFLLYLALCAGAFTVIALTTPAQASETQDASLQPGDVSRGSLLFKASDGSYTPAPTLNTDVKISISGMVVRANVRQTFQNKQAQWLEGVYVFPLPEDAAVDHMRMEVGKRIIIGQIKERQAARHTYEKAKQQGKKTALMEQERPNLFTTAVANIGPGEKIVVEIEYQQILSYDSGQFRLRFPIAITPRYIPGHTSRDDIQHRESVTHFNGLGWAMNTQQVRDASRITPPIHRGDKKINPLSLTIQLNAGFPLARLESAYHDIATTEENGITTITLKKGQVHADRDFELVWEPTTNHAPKAALFSEQIGEEHYHLLMLLPPKTDPSTRQALRREVIFVIDTSGSMAGTSIQQARQALLLALARLRDSDRFNIIEFNSHTDQLFTHARPASAGNRHKARAYVKSLRADGGTQMYPAIEAALKNQPQNHDVRQVVFLTDGSVGNETQLFSLIDKKLGQSRLFTVGIGSAPNSHFMNKAAQFGRGTFTYIGDVNEVHNKMARLFRKLETPVMTQLQSDFGNTASDMYPQHLPDLYEGEPLIITVKTDSDNQPLTISGRRQHEHWQSTLALSNGSPGRGIATLWARRKIDDLMDQRHQGNNQPEIRQQIINVALQHHLVSKYTSLVAVDVTPSRPSSKPLNQTAMPVNLPHGQIDEKIFGRLPQTATPAMLQLIVGMLLVLFSIGLGMRPKKGGT